MDYASPKMEVVGISKTLLNIYQTTQCHIPQDEIFILIVMANLKSQFSQLLCLPKFKNISQSIITIPAILVFLIIQNTEDYFCYLASLITVREVTKQ